MIEINRTGYKKDEKTKINKKKKSMSVTGKVEPFSTQVENRISYAYDGTVEELLEDLKDHEKRLLEMQSFYELNKYRALIKKILKTILDESFSTKTLKRNRKNFADFTIQEIDKKLLDLTTEITKKSKAFDFMKTVDEIRGLIFDLLY